MAEMITRGIDNEVITIEKLEQLQAAALEALERAPVAPVKTKHAGQPRDEFGKFVGRIKKAKTT